MSELFSNLGINVTLLAAQAVNFLLVLWLLNRFVFKKMLRFLEERKLNIQKGVDLTKKAEREMERIGEARTRALTRARQEAEAMLLEARAKGTAAERKALEKAREDAEGIVRKAKEEGERKKQDAFRQAQEELQQSSFNLAEKVRSRTLTNEY
ncbi:MAG: F0F1 ATP synthase subunit B [bacterium]|nr:F0F1 ATP synthase subunit B [bacterium]